MNYTHSSGNPFTVAEASSDARAAFIRRTYGHLAGAILVFIALEAALLSWSGAPNLVGLMTSGYNWAIVLGAFILVSYVADRWAQRATSLTTQYLGLGLFVVAEAIIFLPLLYIAAFYSSPDVIPTAGIITGLLFLGLTVTAFTTRKDFSFLRGALTIGFLVAFGVIIASIFMGFSLGLVFSSVMVLLAAGSILYTTSNILHHYREDQHVAASLALFAAVALLFWYVLRIVMAVTGRD